MKRRLKGILTRDFITTASVIAIGLALMAGAAKPMDLQGTAWQRAAERHPQIDAFMLYAIALIESGRTDQQGHLRPWPWALNVEGKPYFPATKQDALDLLSSHAGKSIDLGLLQVNTRWHGHRVAALPALLEPEINIEIGAAVLDEALSSAPGDLTTGIGRYHSSQPRRGRRYARHVLTLYQHLMHANEKQEERHD
ncbi:MAG: lytic transglycosylase domain-containing protein [Alphaproteobacteria bacterium]|nr:lytic transglycosylase domain-containing protein [Alphaproteobacteria bacterium]